MALVTTAAAVAGFTAAGMYLDAKYHIKKDVTTLRATKKVGQMWAEAVRTNRCSLYYFFEDAVKRQQNEDCIWSRSGCYTWNQAYDRTHRWAQWFLSRGVKPQDLVAFYLQNSPDFIFAWLGLWAIGAAPAMINYNLSGAALLHCLKISGAKVLLVDEEKELRDRIEEVRTTIEGELGMEAHVLDDQKMAEVLSNKPERPGDVFRERVKGNWPMVLLYTSGTTGMPKGCPFNVDRGFPAGASRAAGASLVRDGDRWHNCMPMYHGTGGIMAISMMMIGVTLCIGKKFSTSNFWGEVRDSKATWFTYVGETARYLLAAPPHPQDKDHCVRVMYGNGLRPDVWIKFRERFNVPEVAEFFNSTEGVFGLLNYARGDYLAASVGHHGVLQRRLLKGSYVPVLIDQATGAIARDPKTGFAMRQPYNQGGEIIVSVPDVTAFAGGSGYWKNPAATAKKFEKDVFKKGDLWYRTGDALRRDDDGRWYFLDRLGDTFRWKGENVSTAEVSEVLGKYPGVVEANVYGVALPSHDGRAGCAAVYIDPKDAPTFDYSGFLRHARLHLPKYAVPVFIRKVAKMTPIHNNKQNKVPLREEGVDPDKVAQEDRMYWVDGDNYVPFERRHWDDLVGQRARL
ncbi:acetyl-CoA synthetase-like protein [Coleophoma cylindrospora]|uniref:Very long-chain fatty acid transport protein n=1 Tax=Coleophoma cylindrospora TaxID=1849047 RepID=A0A3D8S1Y2_9HELO|nr:acetyl-CoA synthetase-like protein [Coleophoma cylindrospora]